MTTIAFDGRYLVADSLANQGGLRLSVNKLQEGMFCDGMKYIFGLSGDIADMRVVLTQLNSTASLQAALEHNWEQWYNKSDLQPGVILCVPGARSYTMAGSVWMLLDGPHACGHGRDYALAAMECGRSAVEAVSIAAQFDLFTGGDTKCVDTVLHFNDSTSGDSK